MTVVNNLPCQPAPPCPFLPLSSSPPPSLIDASCPHCSPRCKYRDRTPVYKSLFSLVPRLSTRHCPPRTCCRSPCCGAVSAERRRLLSVDISCPPGTQQQNVCVCVFIFTVAQSRTGWLGSRVVSVLDSGAEGPGFKSQSRRCRVTVSGKLFTPIVTLFTKQRNW